MFEDYPTKTEAQRIARQKTESFDRLIAPSDMDPDAETWQDVSDETLEREAAESTSIQISEDQRGLKGLIDRRAFRIWTDGFRRVSESALNENLSLEELIHSYGIWPNHISKWEAHETAHRVFETPNCKIPKGCWQQAREEVSEAVFEVLTDV